MRPSRISPSLNFTRTHRPVAVGSRTADAPDASGIYHPRSVAQKLPSGAIQSPPRIRFSNCPSTGRDILSFCYCKKRKVKEKACIS